VEAIDEEVEKDKIRKENGNRRGEL